LSTQLIDASGLVFRVRTVNWALLLGAAASFGWQPMDMVVPLCADIDTDDSTREPEGEYDRVGLEDALVRILEILRLDPVSREAEVATGIEEKCNHCRADVHAQRMAAIAALDSANGEVLIEFFLSMLMKGEVAVRQ
jgi:hypothetical protein